VEFNLLRIQFNDSLYLVLAIFTALVDITLPWGSDSVT